MSRRVINLTQGFSPFVHPSSLIGFASSSFYRNTYLPKRLALMKELEVHNENKDWKNVYEGTVSDFKTQIVEVENELNRLNRMPDALPHNPSDLLPTISKSILANMDGLQKDRLEVEIHD